MEQRKAFSNMQTAMTLGDTNSNALGGLVIISSLLTELALTDILFAEADKIRAAADLNNATAPQLAEVDNSVARVLDQVCCIERRVIEKIDRGIEIRNGVARPPM